MIVLTTLVVVFLGTVLWFRRLWFSSLLLHLSRFWTPGPGGEPWRTNAYAGRFVVEEIPAVFSLSGIEKGRGR